MFQENDELTATFMAMSLFLSILEDDNVIISRFNEHFSFGFLHFFFVVFRWKPFFLVSDCFFGSTNSSLLFGLNLWIFLSWNVQGSGT